MEPPSRPTQGLPPGGHDGRIVVVSNRLPLQLVPRPDGGYDAGTASGGLVSAMTPVMHDRGGLWIGWPGLGGSDPALADAVRSITGDGAFRCEPVLLSEQERAGFYAGFCNRVIWPLFHDLQWLCAFEPEYWRSYLAINHRYADVVAGHARQADVVWVHDYQLMGVGKALRDRNHGARLAFFLHTPFPAPDIFGKLPWRDSVLRALLAYDLTGFQTRRDFGNFVDCLAQFLPEAGVRTRGRRLADLQLGTHHLHAGWFPVGIDYRHYHDRPAAPRVLERHGALTDDSGDCQFILGVDRLDYTKGIPERLRAFRNALERYPELRRRVTLIQVVVPSRSGIAEYEDLQARIEQLVGEINGQFTCPGEWVPIQYVFRALEPDELLAYYRACPIALITPLKDGMNLVAKEFCAARGSDGVLVLSEFAGAAAQMSHGALLVNPYDIEGVADAIHLAATMPAGERRARMRTLQRGVRRQDVFWWSDAFIGAAVGRSTSIPVSRHESPRLSVRRVRESR